MHLQTALAGPRREHALKPLIARTPSKRLALVGGFRPTKCGIATFTTDIYEQILTWNSGTEIDVYALAPTAGAPLDDVAWKIVKNDPATYRAAACAINESGADAVWIQHEFGIFGGPNGAMISDLIDGIAAPIIMTLHTVLRAPNEGQRAVMNHLISKVSCFVVMSSAGQSILSEVYGVDPKRVELIEHGAPDRPHVSSSVARAQIGIPERPTIMTFGLLGPGKGLETAIKALPAIKQRHPKVVYRIVGATHPNLVAIEGETYREGLKALAETLGVAANIEWVEVFLETDDLLDQLASCDIYLTPYLNMAQSTSGTLSYAVALGCAVVSTPYVHASEMLADDVGRLVPPNDPASISGAINELLADPILLSQARTRAYRRGRRTIWQEFARRSQLVIDAVTQTRAVEHGRFNLGPPSTTALVAMIDDVGMLQHGKGIVPDRNHGYCTDDTARALMLLNMLGPRYEHLAKRCAAFVQHAWNRDTKRFRNFMSYDRRWLEDVGSDDSNGRALWSLAETAREAHDERLRAWAMMLFDEAAPHLMSLSAIRTRSFLALAADEMLIADPGNAKALRIVERVTPEFKTLMKSVDPNHAHWPWCEGRLTYDNVRIPQAMIAMAGRTQDAELLKAGTAMMRWLCTKHTSAKGHFRPIGSNGFALERGTLPFDQQPVEAWAMVDACRTAMDHAPSPDWMMMARRAYEWYLGRNDRGLVVGDIATGVCNDGITALGLNANAGAESILSFGLAYQSLTRMYEGHLTHAKPAAITTVRSAELSH